MAIDYPFEFTLENGTQVVVKKQDAHHFAFTLVPEDEPEKSFIYDDTVTVTSEMEEGLSFDQLNALRRFWLEREKDELG